MWVLLSSKGSAYSLLTGKEHLVSRRDGDLVLADDQSISRRHAIISVEHDIKDLGDPVKLPVVAVTDTNSKYGIFINEGIEGSVRMANGSRQVLKDGDRIRFGLQWNEWRLEYRPLVITTSTLTPAEKKNLKQSILKLGGHMVGNWRDDVTHVTMTKLTLTVKVVCALALGRPIVTPHYWECYVNALLSKQLIPESKNFIPPLAESSLNVNEVSFDINEKRRKLFSGKKFVFSTEHQFKNYSCMVTAGGGQSCMLKDFITTKVNLVQANVIVLQYSFPRVSQDSQVPDSFEQVATFLKSRGRRLIPESEIGLAILYCSLDKNCNPELNVASTLLSNEATNINSQKQVILALDTQVSESQSFNMEEKIIIPESGTIPKQKSAGLECETLIVPESGTVPKFNLTIPESVSVPQKNTIEGSDTVSETLYSRTAESEINTVPIREASGFLVGRLKRERLSTTDQVDAALNPVKRIRSEDGFLSKHVSPLSITIRTEKSPVKAEVKVESDDEEDLFRFPSDPPIRPSKEDSDEEEDLFAFPDDLKVVQPKICVSKEKVPTFIESSKKRKADVEIEPPSKRSAVEKLDSNSHDKNSTEQISLNDFVSVDPELKENTAVNDSITNLTEGVKNVTVVEFKPLISQKPSTEISEPSRTKMNNFKKFTKVRGAQKHPLIRNKDLIPFEVDTKGLNKWLDDTCNENNVHDYDEDDDEEDIWAFTETSETTTNNSRTRRI